MRILTRNYDDVTEVSQQAVKGKGEGEEKKVQEFRYQEHWAGGPQRKKNSISRKGNPFISAVYFGCFNHPTVHIPKSEFRSRVEDKRVTNKQHKRHVLSILFVFPQQGFFPSLRRYPSFFLIVFCEIADARIGASRFIR